MMTDPPLANSTTDTNTDPISNDQPSRFRLLDKRRIFISRQIPPICNTPLDFLLLNIIGFLNSLIFLKFFQEVTFRQFFLQLTSSLRLGVTAFKQIFLKTYT